MKPNNAILNVARLRATRLAGLAACLSLVTVLGCEKPGDRSNAIAPDVPPSERENNQDNAARPTVGNGGNSTLGRAKNSAENIVNKAEERSKQIADEHGDPYGTDR